MRGKKYEEAKVKVILFSNEQRRAVNRIIRVFRRWRAYFDAKKIRIENKEFTAPDIKGFYAPINEARTREIISDLEKKRYTLRLDLNSNEIEKVRYGLIIA